MVKGLGDGGDGIGSLHGRPTDLSWRSWKTPHCIWCECSDDTLLMRAINQTVAISTTELRRMGS